MEKKLKNPQLQINCYMLGKLYESQLITPSPDESLTYTINGKKFIIDTIYLPESKNPTIIITDANLNQYKLSIKQKLVIKEGDIQFQFKLVDDIVEQGLLSFLKFLSYSLAIHCAIFILLAIYNIMFPPAYSAKKVDADIERVNKLLTKINTEELNIKPAPKPEPPKPLKPKPEISQNPKPIPQKSQPTPSVAKPSPAPQKPLVQNPLPPTPTSQPITKPQIAEGGNPLVKAKVASSLNFLSNSVSTPKILQESNNVNEDTLKRYDKIGSPKGKDPQGSYLADFASKVQTKTSNIKIKNSKEISANVNFDDALNAKGVRGHISASKLQGSSSSFGNFLSGSGMKISGLGTVSESEINKVLSQYVDKLQYCYEKALLIDPSLTGKMNVEWTLNVNRKVSAVKITNTQIHDKNLQKCVVDVIQNIKNFPAPKGGSVIIERPFVFTSTTL